MTRTNQNTGKRKLISWLLTLAMIISLFAGMTGMVNAYTENQLSVTYKDSTTNISVANWDDFTKVTDQQYTKASGNITRENSTHSGTKVENVISTVINASKDDYDRTDFADYIIAFTAGGSSVSFTVGELFGDRYTYGTGEIITDTPATKVDTILEEDGEGKLNLIAGMSDYNTTNGKYWRNDITAITITAPSDPDDPEPSVTADKSWYSSSSALFTLTDEADLKGFAELVTEGNDFNDKTVRLGNSVALTKGWVSIGNTDKVFKGTFDGAGFTISNMNATSGANGFGLFANNEGTIQNIKVSGTINAPSLEIVGGIAGTNNGIIDRCVNDINITAFKKIGGIAGINLGQIEDCVNNGDITGKEGSKSAIGGIVGQSGDKGGGTTNTIINCYNTGAMSNVSSGGNLGRWYGGIAGFADKATTVENCYTIGEIAPGYSWNWNPLIGSVDGGASNPTVNNCYSKEGINAGDDDETTQPYTIGIIKTEAELKAPEMVTLLGSAYAADTVNLNAGYPVLKWQADAKNAADVQALIDAIPTGITAGNMGDVIAAVRAASDAYDELSDDAKALVKGSDKITKAKNASARINHTSGDVTLEGLPWDVKVIASPVAEGAEYDAMKASDQAKGKDLLAMYDIHLEQFNGGQWTLDVNFDGEVTVTITNNAFKGYYKAKAIHQTALVMDAIESPAQYDHEKIDATISGNKVTFKATGFSNYGIVAEKEPVVKTGDSFNLIPILVIMLIAAAGATFAVMQRKRKTQ